MAPSPEPTPGASPAHPAPEAETAPEGTVQGANHDRVDTAPVEREVLYRVTPEGLIVEVSGMRFLPSAKPVKQKDGTWGVLLSVRARSLDQQIHTLLSPEGGPLAIAGHVERKDGKVLPFGDNRNGSDEQFVPPGEAVEVTRTWAGGGERPQLLWGDKLTLEVGLWGLGTPEADRRPLKKLFVVNMQSGANPKAVITPPE